ncbi:MAG: hypothetical protein QXT45_01085 [Candidatus Bilamarchaeaceae archaeon]
MIKSYREPQCSPLLSTGDSNTSKKIEPTSHLFGRNASAKERLRIPSWKELNTTLSVIVNWKQPAAVRLDGLKKMRNFKPLLEDYKKICKALERVMKSEHNDDEIKKEAKETFTLLRERTVSSILNYEPEIPVHINAKQQKNR